MFVYEQIRGTIGGHCSTCPTASRFMEAEDSPERRNRFSDSKQRLRPLLAKRLESDQKVTFRAPKGTPELVGAQNATFWSPLSLFAERGESLILVFFVSDT